MKLATKLASAAGALMIAGTGAVAAFSTSPAAAHVPAVVHLTGAVPGQVVPTPAPAPTTEAPDTGAEATTEPANEPALPGGGHADAPGATADHQFDGVE